MSIGKVIYEVNNGSYLVQDTESKEVYLAELGPGIDGPLLPDEEVNLDLGNTYTRGTPGVNKIVSLAY